MPEWTPKMCNFNKSTVFYVVTQCSLERPWHFGENGTSIFKVKGVKKAENWQKQAASWLNHAWNIMSHTVQYKPHKEYEIARGRMTIVSEVLWENQWEQRKWYLIWTLKLVSCMPYEDKKCWEVACMLEVRLGWDDKSSRQQKRWKVVKEWPLAETAKGWNMRGTIHVLFFTERNLWGKPPAFLLRGFMTYLNISHLPVLVTTQMLLYPDLVLRILVSWSWILCLKFVLHSAMSDLFRFPYI